MDNIERYIHTYIHTYIHNIITRSLLVLQTHALVTSESSPVNEVPQVDDPEQMEAVERGRHIVLLSD